MANLPDGYTAFIKKFFSGGINHKDFLTKHPDFEEKNNQLYNIVDMDTAGEIQEWYNENAELMYEFCLADRIIGQQKSMLAFLQKQTIQEGVIKLKDIKKVIDIGCGTGLIVNFLWWYFKNEFDRDISVVGVDFSSGMLKKAEEIKKKVGSKVILPKKDITKIEVEDEKCTSCLFRQNSADIILMNGVEEYPTKIAPIIYKLLSPNGIFITSGMTLDIAMDIADKMIKKYRFQMIDNQRINKYTEYMHLAFKKETKSCCDVNLMKM